MFDRCVYFNANRLARQVSKIWEEAYAELDLSPSHAYLLRAVLERPGLSQKQLGELLSLEKSTITRSIDRLQERNLLQRKVEEGKGHVSTIHPTDSALEIKDRLNQIGDELYLTMQRTMGSTNVDSLVSWMRSAAHNL